MIGFLSAAAPAIGGALGALGSYLGGKKQAKATEKANAANIAYQKEFAKKGIQWKVADSKAAGIHPLFGLGAQTSSFTPSVQPAYNSGIENAAASLGQGLANYVSPSERRYQEQIKSLDMYNRLLDIEAKTNSIKTARLASAAAFGAQAGVSTGRDIQAQAAADLHSAPKNISGSARLGPGMHVKSDVNQVTDHLRTLGYEDEVIEGMQGIMATTDIIRNWLKGGYSGAQNLYNSYKQNLKNLYKRFAR